VLSLLGVVIYLTHVEWRWIDGAFVGAETSGSEDEFCPATTVAEIETEGDSSSSISFPAVRSPDGGRS
jgi:hypothetical protein